MNKQINSLIKSLEASKERLVGSTVGSQDTCVMEFPLILMDDSKDNEYFNQDFTDEYQDFFRVTKELFNDDNSGLTIKVIPDDEDKPTSLSYVFKVSKGTTNLDYCLKVLKKNL